MLKKIRQSLVIKIGIAAATLAFSVVVGAEMISYYVATEQLKQIIANEMESRAKIITTHIENELRNIVNTLSAAAHNTLFANALADSVGRDHYLRPYLSSFQMVGSIPVRVILSDFRGESLATNPIKVPVEPDMEMLRLTVDSGKPQFKLNPIEKNNMVVTLTYPVLYANTGLPEGSLTYQFVFSKLLGDIFKKEENEKFRVLFADAEKNEKYWALLGVIPPDNALLFRTDLPASDIFPGWLLTVEVWEDQNRLKREMERIKIGYIFLGSMGLFVIIPISLIGAHWILSRLKALEVVAKKVVETRSLEQRFPQEGGDEIANLGEAFNHMIDELNQAYQELKSEANREMKRQSERFKRVLSATLEGYIRIDVNTRMIEDVNEAFCRINGQDCHLWEERPAPEFFKEFLDRAKAAKGPLSWTEEIEIKDVDGKEIAILIHCSLDIDEKGNRQLVSFLTDISDRKAAEAKMHSVNARLSRSIEALKKRDHEMTLLNRMNDFLLASLKIEEAFEIVRIKAEKLFPGLSGSLSILNADSHILDTVIAWGDKEMTFPQFHLEECWGMRQGGLHEISEPVVGSSLRSEPTSLICSHIAKPLKHGSLCVPLVVRGKILGLLWQELIDSDDPVAIERMRRLIISMGDAIKLAISNLELRKALQNQAIKDPLTGLYNRRHFSDIIIRELSRAQRYDIPFSLALIDLDHFKSINDRFGHDAGDKVLIELGKLLREKVRTSDVAFRFGGEEFLLLLPETDSKGAMKCMEHIRTQMENMQIHHNNQYLGVITMSVGVAQYPCHGTEEEGLIRAADNALYQAKSLGRNNVQMAAEN